MKKVIFALIFFNCAACLVSAQDFNLHINFEGIRYDSLYLTNSSIKNEVITIRGISSNGINWDFAIPDSIMDSVDDFYLFPERMNPINHTSYRTVFRTYCSSDTLTYFKLFVDRKLPEIHMKYIGTRILENQLVASLGSKEINDPNPLYTVYLDSLLIPYYENTEFAMSATYPHFGTYLYSFNKKITTYQEYLDYLVGIIQDYPNSQFLFSKIAYHLNYFKTKEDLQRIYGAFSETAYQSGWGKFVKEYLTNYYVFSNTLLPRWDTGSLEPVIQDSTKINLIVFSASWCKPCHEMIPLMKEIYADLKKDIEITYISIDEPKYVDKWLELMRKENLPWRSLVAANEIKSIQKKYNVKMIPYTLLVYPSGKLESIDVRIPDNKEKLYNREKL